MGKRQAVCSSGMRVDKPLKEWPCPSLAFLFYILCFFPSAGPYAKQGIVPALRLIGYAQDQSGGNGGVFLPEGLTPGLWHPLFF